jgi:transposase
MPTATSAVGIDVSRATLDVFIHPQQTHFVVANDPLGIETLRQRMRALPGSRIVLEATGGLEFRAARALADAGCTVSRISPARIHAFRKSLGKHAKTDKLDAALLARYAAIMEPEDRPLPSQADQALRDLAARRRQVVELIGMERNRLKQASDPFIVDSLNAMLAVLTAQRKAIEAALIAAIAADPATRRRFEILTSIKGIGPVVATTLVTDMPELGRLNRRQIASLAGLAPHDRQSGTSLDKSAIRGGRPCVRVALYMAALVASRANPDAKAFYQTLVANGKNKKLALIATARKLVTLANQLIRENRTWSPNMIDT